jgi:hypothetical protein
MVAAERPGWVVVSAVVTESEPNNDFSVLAESGLGVIVRLNNGNSSAGTIPHTGEYGRFALRCAQYVGASKGAHIWIIGNAPNSANERPGNDGSENSGEVITPQSYARCFNACRRAIRALPGHENDRVIPAAIAPFCSQTNYPNNPSGDWVRYFADVLFQISAQNGALDGLALHAYTHGDDASLVSSETMAEGQFAARHWQFRAYRDFLAAVPPTLRNLPVFITESFPVDPGWTGQNRGWIQAACEDVNSWNSNQINQPIQALCFFRWQTRSGDPPGWGMEDKLDVVKDFTEALQYDLRVRWPILRPKPEYRTELIDAAGPPEKGSAATEVVVTAPPYAAEWLQVPQVQEDTIQTNAEFSGRARVKNTGSRTWLKEGGSPVRLGYRWFDSQGVEVPVVPYPGNFQMESDTSPDGTATFDSLVLRPPKRVGTFILIWDLVEEGVTWFSSKGAMTSSQWVRVAAPPPDLAAAWTSVFEIPHVLEPNEVVGGSITVNNAGAQNWNAGGENPVRLSARWYDLVGNHVPGTSNSGDLPLAHDVPPGEAAVFERVTVKAPIPRGKYRLVFDLLKEGVTFFSAGGSRLYDLPIEVRTSACDYSAEWIETISIPLNTLVAGDTVRGSVQVRNTGALPWNHAGENRVTLTYRWSDATGNEIAPSTDNFPLAREVPPRESAVFEKVLVRAPDLPGRYFLKWDLLRESVGWFEAGGSVSAMVPVTIKAPPLDWGAEFLAHDTPPFLCASQETMVDIQIKNIGKNTWVSDGSNRVYSAYSWANMAGEALSEMPRPFAALARDIAPGEMANISAPLVAPSASGAYRLVWDLVIDGICTFEEGGNPACCLTVQVTAEPTQTNLWRAEASHNALSAFMAIDGDLGSFWSSESSQTPGMWFRVDLGTPRLIDGISLRSPGSGYPCGYTLRVSSDGESWRTLCGIPHGNQRDLVASFPPTLVLYAQVDLIVNCEVAWSISDIQIHPTPAWIATASLNNDMAQNAIDNDPETVWQTGQSQTPDVWFQLDLGRPESVSGLCLISATDENPLGYRVSVWNQQAGAWQKVAERRDNRDGIDISFAPVRTQFVNVHLLQEAEEQWAIREAHITKAMTAWVGPSSG